MSFFLLGKSADERYYLVSDSGFETRAAALKELSVITSDSSFDGWDDEILVVDESTGSPVLLVRPNATVAADGVGADVPAESGDEAAVIEASEPAENPQFPTEVEPEVRVEDVVETVDDADITEPVEDALKGALLRSTMQMESEGVVAPESVGQGTAEGASAPASWPWDKTSGDGEPFELSALEEPGEDEGSLVRAAGDDETMAVARPVIMGAYADSAERSEDAAEVSEEPVESEVSDAPDDSAMMVPDDELAEVPEEADADEMEDADEEADAGEMEDSGEPPAEELEAQLAEEPEAEAGDAPDTEPESTPSAEVPAIDPSSDFVDLSTATPVDTGALEAAMSEPSTATDSPLADPMSESAVEPSDAVASEPVESPVPQPEASAPTVEGSVAPLEPADSSDEEITPIGAMTCNDCVYVETCPNRGQLAPESCGSFQWK